MKRTLNTVGYYYYTDNEQCLDFLGERTLKRGWHYSWVIFAAWGCSSFWCHTTHSHIQSTISLNSKEFWFFSLINLIWDFVKHKKITFQILIRHHDCKTQKKKLAWNSYFTFHECTFLNPFCISALIRVYRWKKLAAIMPWGVVWEILFDLLCTKVKFISRRHVSFFDRDSSVIPAVNFKK